MERHLHALFWIRPLADSACKNVHFLVKRHLASSLSSWPEHSTWSFYDMNQSLRMLIIPFTFVATYLCLLRPIPPVTLGSSWKLAPEELCQNVSFFTDSLMQVAERGRFVTTKWVFQSTIHPPVCRPRTALAKLLKHFLPSNEND